ncbi:MAG: hypothetical protein GX295_09220 [Syntrophomonadaceae bacterium]|nr:hypothetical protein [Syntrophomonadaceae bacterium]
MGAGEGINVAGRGSEKPAGQVGLMGYLAYLAGWFSLSLRQIKVLTTEARSWGVI